MKKVKQTPTIAPIHNLSWYHMTVYKLFFKVFDPILRNRLDIILLFKRHIDSYVQKQFDGAKLPDIQYNQKELITTTKRH